MMMNKEELNNLNGKWTHSFEEDSGDEIVYRPADRSFPRSRGRAQLELMENGVAATLEIGKNDVPDPVKGTWKVEGDQLLLTFPDGRQQMYAIKEVKADKLVLKRKLLVSFE